jgi:apolipoprotein N-acyltransferase
VLAWIALAPLLVCLLEGSLTRAFLLGLTTGVIYFAGTLYWISHVITVHSGLEGGAVLWVIAGLINAALVAYLALFPALFAVIVRKLCDRFGPMALMASPLVWVTTELGRTYLFTGFPWVLLGYSQTSVLPIAQLASVFGVYGLSGLVASVGAGLAASVALQARGSAVVRRLAPLAAPLLVVAIVAVWGNGRVQRSDLTREGETVRVGLIQGNVPQDEKWDRDKEAAIFDQYLRMTEQAIGGGAEAVIWPEASMPFLFEEEPSKTNRLRLIAKQASVPILVGSNQIERGEPPRFYNAAFVVGPDGGTAGVYQKMHLVPFGEYVPLKELLFFAAPLVERVGPFSEGDQPVLLPFKQRLVSTAICYEIVYPNLVRQSVAGGSELLTTITNDAWFGRTSAPYQHFSQAAMRAIENGRYLVRAANTGLSGVVDPYGRVLTNSGLFEPAVIVSEVRFLTFATFYARFGDIFAYASMIVTIAMVGLVRSGSRARVQ